MNLQIIRKKFSQIKLFLTYHSEIAISLIILLVGLASFGLGRLSMSEQHPPVRILQCTDKTKENFIPKIYPGGAVVASWKGKKYHYPWCAGALRISDKNKRWFKSEKEAEAFGYKPSTNCIGIHHK